MGFRDSCLQGFRLRIFSPSRISVLFSPFIVFLLLSGDLGGFEDLVGGIFAVEALEV